MKSRLVAFNSFLLSSLASLSFTHTSFGTSISVNFHANDSDALPAHQLASGEFAGLDAVAGELWTNVNVGNAQTRTGASIFAPTSLKDSLGNDTAATISSTLTTGTSGSWFVGYAASSASNGGELSNGIPDDNLFNSYLATNASDRFVLNITGLGTDFTEEGYRLVIYSDSDRRNSSANNVRRSVYTVTPNNGDSVIAFVEDDDGAAAVNIFDGTYIESDGVDDGADYSNYVVIDGLNATDFTLEIDSPDGGRGAISGFEIIAGTDGSFLPSPNIVSFGADDLYVQPGSAIQLSWEVENTETLTLNPGNIDVTGTTGIALTPEATTTYTLTATNENSSAIEPLDVTIGPERPNILLCLVDDWGVMDTSVPFSYNSYTDDAEPVVRGFNNFYQTPSLEQLADDGMIFTQAYALPVCSPTRTSLMTGFNAPRHGVTVHINLNGTYERPSGSNVATHRSPNNWRFRGMEVTDVTLPRLLSESGYRSIHCGKGHFGARGDVTEDPTAIGFDVNLGGSGGGSPGRYIGNPGYSSANNPVPNITEYEGNGKYLTVALTEAISDAMEDAVDDGVPFFSYMSYYAVHTPFTNNPNATGDYSDAVSTSHNRFATMVEGVDTSLAQLRAKLEELGEAENTLILFVGDNGSDSPALSNGGAINSRQFSDYPIRGKKANCYEGGYHVPLFAAWAKSDPDNQFQQRLPIVPGSVEHDIVSVVDIPTTILSVADVAHPDMDGVDLSDYLTSTPGTHREQTLLRHQPNSHNSSFFTTYRRDDFKLIYFYYKDPEEAFELYDLSADRDESDNIASSNPQLVLQLAREMAGALDRGWGEYGALWPTFNGGGDADRPFEDDPFFISFAVDGRDTVDSDSDELPDAVEDTNQDGLVDFGETDPENGDSDNDTFLDGAELRTGTDPLNAASYFSAAIELITSANARLTWPSAEGAEYQILGSDDLEEWDVLVDEIPASTLEAETSREMAVSEDGRMFFQINLLPAPTE